MFIYNFLFSFFFLFLFLCSQAGLLRQLSEFYVKEASHLFVVRIAQGLNSLGKGLIGLGPFHSDRWGQGL